MDDLNSLLKGTDVVMHSDHPESSEHIIGEQNALISAAIESSVDGFILIGDDGLIKMFNRACERLFGYKKEEIIGKPINLLMPHEHAKQHDSHLKRYLTTGMAHIVGRGREVPGLRKDGTQIPIYLAVNEVRYGDKVSFSGIIRDLSMQKEQERILIEETMKRSVAEEKNFNLSQSLKYATKIQQSILPSEHDLSSVLDYFIVFKPKEMVSGDFYWMMQKGPYIFVAVVDCTGHGIPGAFVSMLGHTHLNYATSQSRSNSPAKILQHLDERIDKAMGTSTEEGVKDSMDIALIRIQPETREIVFAGARRPFILFTHKSHTEIKGDRHSVGHDFVSKKEFHDQTFHLESGDSFYLFSDGITDQIGKNDAKYGRKSLLEFFENHQDRSMRELGNALELEHYRWLHGHPQTDDITVFGIRL